MMPISSKFNLPYDTSGKRIAFGAGSVEFKSRAD